MLKKTYMALLVGTSLFAAADLKAQTTPAPQPSICNRACWTARNGTCTTTMAALTRAIIHHTASSADWNVTTINDSKARMRSHQNYHMDSNGWCDLGYHFTVDKLGNIFEGRKNSMTSLIKGTHAGCGNTDTFGFTFLGYCHSPYNQDPPVAMQNAIYDVIAWRMPAGWNPYGARTTYSGSLNGTAAPVDYHKWVGASGTSGCTTTSCPGDIVINTYITQNFTGGPMRTGIATRRSSPVIVDGATGGSASWTTATSSTDKYGADYRWRWTESASDAVTFTGNLASTKTYTVSAWWPQGGNRSTTAPYLVDHSGGSTTVHVNQQINGGKWNSLGSYSCNSGNNTVRLSCWTTTGFVVVADAVKWE